MTFSYHWGRWVQRDLRRPVAILSLSVLALVFCVLTANAQSEGELLELPHDWELGQSQRLLVTKGKDQLQNGAVVQSQSATTPVTVEVIDKSEDGYVVRWTLGRTEAADPAAQENPIAAKIGNITEGLNLDMITDPYGSVVGLANKKEVLGKVDQVIEELYRFIEDVSPSPEAAAQLRGMVEPLMANMLSEQALEASLLQDPQLFYMPVGGSYELGVPYPYEDLLPNPLGGAPFPSQAYLVLKEFDRAGARAAIEWGQNLDPERTKEILLENFTAIAESSGTPPPKADDLPAMTIEDTSSYEIDTDSGWPLALSYTRTVTFGPQSNVEHLKIEAVGD